MKAKYCFMPTIMLLILICNFSCKKISKESFSLNTRGMIAFSNTPADDNNEIYTINSDGKGLQRVTNHRGRDCVPAWSPDSSQIVFQSDRDGNYEIYKMNLDGTNQIRLTNNPA